MHNFQHFTAPVDREQIYQWILELASSETRETALLELSKKREVVPDLAPMLWHSYGTIAALLQEIIAIYPAINPPVLTAHQSNRVCNALGKENEHLLDIVEIYSRRKNISSNHLFSNLVVNMLLSRNFC